MPTALTKDSLATEQGTIVGTFQYMSPEQVDGKDVDGRSDIFSLGAVLYEMLTGQRAFEGKSQLSVATSIIEREPVPIRAIKPTTPLALEHIIKKCLAKVPEERWQSGSDLASELKWVVESGGHAVVTAEPAGPGKTRERLAWVLAGTFCVALIVSALWWRNPKAPEQTMYFSASLPFSARDIAVAPNGHTIAVLGYLESARKNVIWIYELGSPNANSLADTEGATFPFWSPDSRSVAFFADGKLKKVERPGGPAQIVCDAPAGRGGTWNKDGLIVFTPEAILGPGRGLYRVAASGGTPVRISDPDVSRGEQNHRWAVFLPDGKHYLYLAANFSGQKGVNAIFAGSLDSDEKRFVVDATANAAYAAPGYLLFPREKTLFAQRFDVNRLAVTGEPTAILTDLQYQPQIRRAVFAVSDNGLLAAQTGRGVALSQPIWFDRKGNEVGTLLKPNVYQNISVSPNGRSVAVDIADMGSQNMNSDVWIVDLQRDSAKRLTFPPSNQVVPLWSPDASRIMFASNREMHFDLYMKNSDGTQERKAL
jgi:Tol biopolymer transport system component